MKLLIVATLAVLPSIAFASPDTNTQGPKQGTFAGQTTRGEVVNLNIDQKTRLYGNGGYGYAVSTMAKAGERHPPEQIGRDTEVGYGNAPTDK